MCTVHFLRKGTTLELRLKCVSVSRSQGLFAYKFNRHTTGQPTHVHLCAVNVHLNTLDEHISISIVNTSN